MLTGYGLLELRGARVRLLRGFLAARKSCEHAPRIGRAAGRAFWTGCVAGVLLTVTAFLTAPLSARATTAPAVHEAVAGKAEASTQPLTEEERHLGIAAICLATQVLANDRQHTHDPLKLAQSLAEKFPHASPRMDWVIRHLLTLYEPPVEVRIKSAKSSSSESGAPVTEQPWNEDDCPPPGTVYGLAAPLASGEIGKVFARDMAH